MKILLFLSQITFQTTIGRNFQLLSNRSYLHFDTIDQIITTHLRACPGTMLFFVLKDFLEIV